MNKCIKDIYDEGSMIKDIEDIKNIIHNYQKNGIFDRNDAIKKIQELRSKDKDILTITSVTPTRFFVPFSQATNDQLVGELIMQRNILAAKLAVKQ